jgi:prolyl-tRNA editing enzyme YbaK/EbsC (Cys-tRNA(Pro) deacylase)
VHPRAEEFRARARELGFDPEVREFDAGTATAADAATAIGCAVAQIASSIALAVEPADDACAGTSEPADDENGDGATDPGMVVVVTSGAGRVDTDRVAAHLGAASVELADPDEVESTLGWPVGGVPPFCHDRPVGVLVDETLFDHDQVWAAAGTPEAVFPVAPADLLELTDGERVRVRGD